MIKKILSLIALVASVAACTDDYKDWANPQVVPQPDAVSFTDGNVSAVGVINFADFMPGQTTVKVCNITAPTASQETYAPVYNIQLGDNTYELSVDGAMKIGDLVEYVQATYGKAPIERTIDATVSMWLDNKLTSVKTGTAAVTIKAVPDAPFIDTGYWLTGDFAGWNKEGALPFTHLGGGDVYDNPEFQIVFTTTADNQYWKIIPQNNYDNDFWAGGEKGVVGTIVDGDTSMEGMLVTDNPQAGKIEKAGIYRMTINMMNYTYKIEKLEFAQFVYFIGATDGWQASDQKLETVTYDGVYTGYVYCADPNGWGNCMKFQRTPGSWDNEINSATFTGGITGDFGPHDGDTNIEAKAGEGVYFVTMNLAAGTLNAVKVNKMGIIGDFNGWGGDVDMTWNATDYCFEATNAGVTANGWKFRVNSDWGINLGANDTVEPSAVLTDLVANGKNLGVAGNTIKLYPTRKTSNKIYCTVE